MFTYILPKIIVSSFRRIICSLIYYSTAIAAIVFPHQSQLFSYSFSEFPQYLRQFIHFFVMHRCWYTDAGNNNHVFKQETFITKS